MRLIFVAKSQSIASSMQVKQALWSDNSKLWKLFRQCSFSLAVWGAFAHFVFTGAKATSEFGILRDTGARATSESGIRRGTGTNARG